MTASRDLLGSEPDIEVADKDAGASSPVTVHFDARPVRAATCVEQEAQSVVVREASTFPPAPDPADVTLTLRARAGSRSASSRIVAWLEARWVFLVVALAVPIALLLGMRLWR